MRGTLTWVSGGVLLMAAWPAFGRQDEPATESAEHAPNATCSESSEVVEFNTNSAKLSDNDQERLDTVVEWLQQDDGRYSRVEGYADPRGSAAANVRLSERRALAVERYMTEQGIAPSRVHVKARGETDVPPAPGASERVAVVRECAKTEAALTQATPAPEPAPAPPPEPTPEPPPPPAAPPVVEEPPMPSTGAVAGVSGGPGEPTHPYSGIGMGLSAGGGVIGFTDTQTRNNTNDGGTWEARLTIGTRIPIGLDLAYVGSAQGLTAAGLSTNAYILGNGAEADLRLQWPTGMFRPYLFGGIGWTHYSVQRSDVLGTAILHDDNIGTVPFGAGLAIGKVNGLLFDVRGTGRMAFDDDLLAGLYSGTGQDARLHSWSVTARIGAEW
jgi:outer membrane protein OmpA-like peptidoglycan-associated protein